MNSLYLRRLTDIHTKELLSFNRSTKLVNRHLTLATNQIRSTPLSRTNRNANCYLLSSCQTRYDFSAGHYHITKLNYATAHDHHDSNDDFIKKSSTWGIRFAAAAVVGFGAYLLFDTFKITFPKRSGSKSTTAGHEFGGHIRKDLPEYRAIEVAEHYDANSRIWVSFRHGVYDVTEFVELHPGGSRIMMAAGASLEPFWDLYPVHQRKDVFDILEKYRIGNLSPEDLYQADVTGDAFEGEPKRHACLVPRSKKPFNGETPPSLLPERFYTPNDLFYVRNHLPVPQVDAKSYNLEIEGLNLGKETSLSLEDLKKFPKVTISATIQCGGNRRSEMGKSKSVAGLAWSGGAIGNAKWTGVRLKDVLKAAGFDESKYKSNPEKYHIQFEGMDSDQSGECYGASIPLSYILDGNFEPVLALEMNDKTLPMDHGFPLRIILPGIVGARSVKWLSRIIISDQESLSPWQQRDFKVFAPNVTMETVDFSAAPAIMDTPVTSYICSHDSGDKVKSGQVPIQGYAFSGGGRKIIRVEISKDQGKSWEVTTIKEADKSPSKRNWSWVIWETKLQLGKGNQEIWVKAVDSGYNQQVEDFRNIWNYRGLLSTAYHKISLQVS